VRGADADLRALRGHLLPDSGDIMSTLSPYLRPYLPYPRHATASDGK
jgi:hypothetical protein